MTLFSSLLIHSTTITLRSSYAFSFVFVHCVFALYNRRRRHRRRRGLTTDGGRRLQYCCLFARSLGRIASPRNRTIHPPQTTQTRTNVAEHSEKSHTHTHTTAASIKRRFARARVSSVGRSSVPPPIPFIPSTRALRAFAARLFSTSSFFSNTLDKIITIAYSSAVPPSIHRGTISPLFLSCFFCSNVVLAFAFLSLSLFCTITFFTALRVVAVRGGDLRTYFRRKRLLGWSGPHASIRF